MALSATKLILFVCVLCFFSVQIHARESQFFSKIRSSNSNNYVQVTPNNKGEQRLSKQVQQESTGFAPETQTTTTAATTLNKQQEPSFIPETQNGYGLYGQENSKFPITTTSAADVKYEPYTTPVTSTPAGTFEPYTTTPTTTTTTSAAVKYELYTTPITSTATGAFELYSATPTTSYNNNNSPNKYNNGFEAEEQESLGDSKFQESGYASNNVEKQGISDTRYLENGRYYYDAKNENRYHPNHYQQQNSRGYHNGNIYEYNNNDNSMERYQNEENEFDELP